MRLLMSLCGLLWFALFASAESKWSLHQVAVDGATVADGTVTEATAVPAEGGVTLSATGTMAKQADGMAFYATPVEGDFVLTARVAASSADDAGSRLGLVARAGEAADAEFVALMRREAKDWFATLSRTPAGWQSSDRFVGAGNAHDWLRLERHGDVFTSYHSPEGLYWQQLGRVEAELPPQLLVGVTAVGPERQTVTFNALTVGEAGPREPVMFQQLEPTAPSARPFWNTMRLNERILQPRSPDNPRGYHRQGPPFDPVYKSPDPPIDGVDVLGPDGRYYPNFTWAGVRGGIPDDLPVVATIAADTADFAGDLERAVQEAAAAGGGVVQIPPGTFVLDRPFVLSKDRVVIRGSGDVGPEATTIEFRYGLRPGQLRWFTLTDPQQTHVVGLGDLIEVHADLDLPAEAPGKAELRLTIGQKQIARFAYRSDEAGRFAASANGRQLRSQGVEAGVHTVTATVTWKDGTTTTETRQIDFRPDVQGPLSDPGAEAAITLFGRRHPGRTPLTQGLPRGGRELHVASNPGIRPGDYVEIFAGADPAWIERIKAVPMSQGGAAFFRKVILRIDRVEGNRLIAEQPVRIELPMTVDAVKFGPRIERITPVQFSGIEDLRLVTTEKIWTHGILLRDAANCWVKNVTIDKAGRNGFWTRDAKWCEARDIEVHDAWFKQGGGTAYVGWESAYDCLMDGVVSSKLRHGPNIQWASSGCVIRNGVFEDSDAQFHAGWVAENLLENCTVVSRVGHGSYGYGLFVNGPESHIHGPQGPRNVLWNNDIRSSYATVWMGGMNEAYLVMHNRLEADIGPAVLLKQGAFDNTFAGNVFVTHQPEPAAVYLVTPDCVGNTFVDNTFYGVVANEKAPSAAVVAGAVKPAEASNNQLRPPGQDVPRPQPRVPSLYEWQLHQPWAATPTR